MRSRSGFTLMEMLLALLVLSILSLMLSSGLRTVIGLSSRVQDTAEAMQSLEMGLVLMNHNVEQAINRPVRNAANQEVPAFIGTSYDFWLTHGGSSDPTGESVQSNLSRAHYVIQGDRLIKEDAPVLDQAKEMPLSKHVLISGVEDGRFDYMDKEKHWKSDWKSGGQNQELPIAVRFQGRVRGLGGIVQWMIMQPNPV